MIYVETNEKGDVIIEDQNVTSDCVNAVFEHLMLTGQRYEFSLDTGETAILMVRTGEELEQEILASEAPSLYVVGTPTGYKDGNGVEFKTGDKVYSINQDNYREEGTIVGEEGSFFIEYLDGMAPLRDSTNYDYPVYIEV